MKFLDKVYKINADNENYIDGYRLELTNLETEFIIRALELAEDLDTDQNPFCQEHELLLNKFKYLKTLAGKGLTNFEIEGNEDF